MKRRVLGPTTTPPASNFFVAEVATKRLWLLRNLVPKAVRIAVLVNPANAPLRSPSNQSPFPAVPHHSSSRCCGGATLVDDGMLSPRSRVRE